jgi:hypothetical protein
MVIYASFYDIHRVLERYDTNSKFLRQQQLTIGEQLFWNARSGATLYEVVKSSRVEANLKMEKTECVQQKSPVLVQRPFTAIDETKQLCYNFFSEFSLKISRSSKMSELDSDMQSLIQSRMPQFSLPGHVVDQSLKYAHDIRIHKIEPCTVLPSAPQMVGCSSSSRFSTLFFVYHIIEPKFI